MSVSEEADDARISVLLDVMREHDLDALTVRVGEQTLEIVRRESLASAAPAFADKEAADGSAGAALPGKAESGVKVLAPIVGVFYRAASPGSEPYVEVGDRVEAGHVLCILEAMKLMNEITSDHAGTVRRILPENGALVSLGEELFWIEP